jgi:hypothetical protein
MVTVDAPISQFTGGVICEWLMAKGAGVVTPAITTALGNIL